MVRDHFRPFLIKGRKPSRLGGFSAGTKAPVKTHVLWFLVASGASFAAWKASKFHTVYKQMQKV